LFRPGVAVITPPGDAHSIIHARNADPPFIPLARHSFTQLAQEHKLPWQAQALLIWLLFATSHVTNELPEGWTKTRITEEWGIGWRCLTSTLDVLHAAGLITYKVTRGHDMTLMLNVRSALQAPVARTPLPRHQRRSVTKDASAGRGQAYDIAARLARHFRLQGQPQALLNAIAAAISAGIPERELIENVCARGKLAQANDPWAVVISRIKSAHQEIAEACQYRQQQRERKEQVAQQAIGEEQSREADIDRSAAQYRWITETLDRLPTGRELRGVPSWLQDRPVPVTLVSDRLSEVVERHPDIDPAALARKWADSGYNVDNVDVVGLAPRDERKHGPPGTLPLR
jgi:hypothetical protein